MDPFEFYLEAGEHTLTLDANREPMAISKITIYPFEEAPSYEEKLAEWKSAGLTEISLDEGIRIEGEQPTTISMQSMFPANDRTSALTQPQDPARIRYNILDYDKCNML